MAPPPLTRIEVRVGPPLRVPRRLGDWERGLLPRSSFFMDRGSWEAGQKEEVGALKEASSSTNKSRGSPLNSQGALDARSGVLEASNKIAWIPNSYFFYVFSMYMPIKGHHYQ